jgi:hypothetical protein
MQWQCKKKRVGSCCGYLCQKSACPAAKLLSNRPQRRACNGSGSGGRWHGLYTVTTQKLKRRQCQANFRRAAALPTWACSSKPAALPLARCLLGSARCTALCYSLNQHCFADNEVTKTLTASLQSLQLTCQNLEPQARWEPCAPRCASSSAG